MDWNIAEILNNIKDKLSNFQINHLPMGENKTFDQRGIVVVDAVQLWRDIEPA